MDIHDIPESHYHFLTFFWVLASGPLYADQWAPFSSALPPVAQTTSYATGSNLFYSQ